MLGGLKDLGYPNVEDETQMKLEEFVIKCSRCHMDEHNKATCNLPMPLAQETTWQNTSQATPIESAPPS